VIDHRERMRLPVIRSKHNRFQADRLSSTGSGNDGRDIQRIKTDFLWPAWLRP
jgi:hypothetical protein